MRAFKFGDSGRKIPEYTYNWPYDFFSLVELVQIESGIIIESEESKQSKKVE